MNRSGDDDALMYAITGEQPPASLRGTEEMAAAQEAVSALRRGMDVLGAELAAAPASTAPLSPAPHSPAAPMSAAESAPLSSAAPMSVADSPLLPSAAPMSPAGSPPASAIRRFRPRPWMLAAAAAVVGAAVVGGLVMSRTDPADTAGSRSLPGVVACAETIASGELRTISPMGDGFALTVDPVRYLKPADGPATLTVRDARLPLGGETAAPAVGDRVVVVVHDPADIDLFTGTDADSEWDWMTKALPGSLSIDPGGC
jgi:hypothetical protein